MIFPVFFTKDYLCALPDTPIGIFFSEIRPPVPSGIPSEISLGVSHKNSSPEIILNISQ